MTIYLKVQKRIREKSEVQIYYISQNALHSDYISYDIQMCVCKYIKKLYIYIYIYSCIYTPSHERGKEGRPARTYMQQLCTDTRYRLEDLPGAMDNRDGWRGKVREIRADGVTR